MASLHSVVGGLFLLKIEVNFSSLKLGCSEFEVKLL